MGSRSRSRSPRALDKKGSRSRSRSRRSRSHSRGPEDKRPADFGVDTIKVTDDDAAFICGKGGRTKEKIARVSGAEIELFEKELVLEIRGTEIQRKRGKKYCKCVMDQRSGPVSVTDKDDDDGDLTLVQVPQRAAGFVTGKAGNFLRMIEDEWNTLMFFCDVDKKNKDREFEKLAIFGTIRGRRGSELKALNAVETLVPGYFDKIKDEIVERDNGNDETGTWGTDTMVFEDHELSYALGKQGNTRKKLEKACGAVVQYIGHCCLFSGPKPERRRAKDYIKFLFGQLDGPVYVDNWEDRDDCVVVHVPSDCIGYITGARRAALSSVEDRYGTLMFFMNKDGDKGGRGGWSEKLIIFGDQRGRRGAELKCMHEIEKKQPGIFTKDLGEKESDYDGFDTDRMRISEDSLSYVIGKEASTQTKIEKAAGCILLYVGTFAYIAGDRKQRQRCRDYLTWLLKQLKGAVTVRDVARRDDCTEMFIPGNCKGWVMGNRGSELRRVEKETGVFTFMALDDSGEERLLIFSCDPGSKNSSVGRAAAERMINATVQEKLNGNDRPRHRSESRPRRSRSPPRKRGRSDSRRPPPRRSPPRRSPPRRNDSRPPPRRSPPRRSPPRRSSPPAQRYSSRSPPRGGRSYQDPPPRNDSRARGGGGGGGRNSGRNDSRDRGGYRR